MEEDWENREVKHGGKVEKKAKWRKKDKGLINETCCFRVQDIIKQKLWRMSLTIVSLITERERKKTERREKGKGFRN